MKEINIMVVDSQGGGLGKQLVSAIKKECGVYGAVIADVNDLKRAAIIGWTEGVDPAKVSQILIDNPFGNASQKTPICIIKNYNKD